MKNSLIIRCENLTKHYFLGVTRRKIEALNDLNLEIEAGEVFAYIGLNGAGKSTTIKLLLDHARPTRGEISIFGKSSTDPDARFRIGYMPDMPHFYRFLTVYELLDYFGKLFGLDKSARGKRSEELIELVGLTGRGDEPLGGFSRGMLQRTALAQALINDPDLLILDEPLGGLDPIGRADLMRIMRDLKERGKTLFFSSHILEDAQKIADRVGIIHKGRLLACGKLNELLESEPGWEVELLNGDSEQIKSLVEQNSWAMVALNGRTTVKIINDNDLKKLHKLAGEGAVDIGNINRIQLNLEDVFLKEVRE